MGQVSLRRTKHRYRIKNGQQLYNEGKELERIEVEKAKRRQGTRIDLPNIVENFPQCERGKTRDIVAKAIGLGSGKHLRYDYGLSEIQIMARLDVPQRTISHWVSHNSNGRFSHNPATFTHLEGDCLERSKDIPDHSAEAISLRYDYGWTERRIADRLGIAKTVLHEWVVGNGNRRLVGNPTTFTHLEN